MMKRFGILLILMVVCWHGFGQEGLLRPIPVDAQYRKALPPMLLLAKAIEDYVMDMEKPPAVNSIQELLNHDTGFGLTFTQFYLEELPEELVPVQDIWGNDFIYHVEGDRFFLASGGSDGRFGGFKQTGVYLFRPEMAGRDIIYSNQGFVLRPITVEEARAASGIQQLIFFLLPTVYCPHIVPIL